MITRKVTISAKDNRDNGIMGLKIEAKLQLSGQSPDESKKTTEQFRDRLFALVNEYFYVSEIKQ